MNNRYKKLMDLRRDNWLAISGQKSDIAEIRIDGVVGIDWSDDDKTASQFITELNAISAPEIHLHINSPGGDVFHGLAMYHALHACGKTVTGFVDGVAGSISSVLLMAASRIVMPESTYLMIHDPWSFVAGNARELRALADELDGIGEKLAKIYSDRGGADIGRIRQLMHGNDGADGTFLDAAACMELGLCDEIRENVKAAACAGLDIYGNVPEPLRRIGDAMNKRDLESSLRDAGYSAAEAKKIASGKAFDRDGGGLDREKWQNVLEKLKKGE